MSHQDLPSSNTNPKIQKLIEELTDEAKAEGLSWMELAVKRDPAMADIMARMINPGASYV